MTRYTCFPLFSTLLHTSYRNTVQASLHILSLSLSTTSVHAITQLFFLSCSLVYIPTYILELYALALSHHPTLNSCYAPQFFFHFFGQKSDTLPPSYTVTRLCEHRSRPSPTCFSSSILIPLRISRCSTALASPVSRSRTNIQPMSMPAS